MAQTKAPETKPALDPESESWNKLPWRTLEQHVYRIQKRIFKAKQQGNLQAVHTLQKLLMKSRAARLLAVRRVTQDNQGKKTAGVDGVKSVPPQQRLEMVENIHPKHWKHIKAHPVRRIYIPKPGKAEKRPLGIPVMVMRAQQALAKSALEPEWEACFEANSYGFRPGRSCQDAIQAIFLAICKKPKYVLDADIAGCFDHIEQEALLAKLQTYPAMRRTIHAWLKAGLLDQGVFAPTTRGTPQGGVISPLLMNVALHGLETFVVHELTRRTGKPSRKVSPTVIRYADDFVVLDEDLSIIEQAKDLIATWLKDMGLELKPSKTHITHTLESYQHMSGFDFLGWTVRQFPVGKTHTGTDRWGNALGFKTIITPSKKAIKRHVQELKALIRKNSHASQGQLIKELNQVIHGWTNYYRSMVATETFHHCRFILFQQLQSWARRRHPHKGMFWVSNTYWHVAEGKGWIFSDQKSVLWEHDRTEIQRHRKVKGTASPYDGDVLYWSQRLRRHPMINGTLGKLLQRQSGKCRWCELLFQDGDIIEIDHITPKSQGGGEALSNKCALHRHCHDQRHAQRVNGTHDKGQITEEPDDANVSRPVLKPSGGGDPFA
jgi:RNA-directed DNA polymerase